MKLNRLITNIGKFSRWTHRPGELIKANGSLTMTPKETEATLLARAYALILSWEENKTTSPDMLGGETGKVDEAGGTLPIGEDSTIAPQFYPESDK